MVIPASQGTTLNLAAGGGIEPPITGSKPVAVTAWLPGCVSLFRADGAAFACHAESGKRTADIRLSLREVGVCAGILFRAPLRIHPSKQRLFTFQSGGRGGIRTHGCFHIGGFQDRCLSPLGNPSFWIGYWVTPRRNRTSFPAGLTGATSLHVAFIGRSLATILEARGHVMASPACCPSFSRPTG